MTSEAKFADFVVGADPLAAKGCCSGADAKSLAAWRLRLCRDGDAVGPM